MMLLFSINTFWSLTQALSTLRKVWVARLTAMLIASSKLWSEVALSSVTLATDIEEAPFFRFPCRECPTPHNEGIKLEAAVRSTEIRQIRSLASRLHDSEKEAYKLLSAQPKAEALEGRRSPQLPARFARDCCTSGRVRTSRSDPSLRWRTRNRSTSIKFALFMRARGPHLLKSGAPSGVVGHPRSDTAV